MRKSERASEKQREKEAEGAKTQATIFGTKEAAQSSSNSKRFGIYEHKNSKKII